MIIISASDVNASNTAKPITVASTYPLSQLVDDMKNLALKEYYPKFHPTHQDGDTLDVQVSYCNSKWIYVPIAENYTGTAISIVFDGSAYLQAEIRVIPFQPLNSVIIGQYY